jgi:hypothetical protein
LNYTNKLHQNVFCRDDFVWTYAFDAVAMVAFSIDAIIEERLAGPNENLVSPTVAVIPSPI